MRYVNDYSPKEIASILGESENAVSVRINRGIKKVQEMLNLTH
jgi:DNA-directed RNA polymerase specialized sigma24 family protein